MNNMTKKNQLYLLSTSLIALTIFAGISYMPNGMDDSDNTASAQTPTIQLPILPDTPNTVPILTVTVHEQTPERVSAVAKEVFGINGPVERFSTGYSVTDGVNLLKIHDTGAIKYTTLSWSDTDYETNLFVEKDLISIADSYIDKVRKAGLIPNDPKFSIDLDKVVVGSESIDATITGEILDSRIHYMDVDYKQKYMDKELLGGSNDVRVSIGKDGEILAFFGFWRNLTPVDTLPVKVTAQEAIDKVLSKSDFNVRAPIPTPLDKTIIDEISLVYVFDNPVGATNNVYPYWGIKGQLVGEDGTIENFVQKVRLG